VKEADEEQQLWIDVKSSGNRIDGLVVGSRSHKLDLQVDANVLNRLSIMRNGVACRRSSNYSTYNIVRQLYWTIGSRSRTNKSIARDEDPSEQLEDELMRLTRENVKICDELVAALEGDSEGDTTSLLGALSLLSALRASSETDAATPVSRIASNGKSGRNNKRKGDNSSVVSDDRESAAAESPAAPSPKVHIPVPSRLKVNTNASSRAGSVGAGREASVKIEEGTESGVDAKCIGDPFLLVISAAFPRFIPVKRSTPLTHMSQQIHSIDRDFKSEPRFFGAERAARKSSIPTMAKECFVKSLP
jgi:hypothetical protein